MIRLLTACLAVLSLCGCTAQNPPAAGDAKLAPATSAAKPAPAAAEWFIDGAVERPGVYALTDRQTTVSQAVASAALKPNADRAHVVLLRLTGPDTQQELPVDLDKIAHHQAADIPLRAGDLIRVPTAPAPAASK
jgi:protein involved in polysaccharide export with SLBB domain